MHQANTCLHFCGALQQRAPPQLAILDEHVKPVEEDPEWAQVAEMPKILHSQMKEIQELLDKLPQPKDHVRSKDTFQEVHRLVNLCAPLAAATPHVHMNHSVMEKTALLSVELLINDK